tara:strand:+ start:2601 stop:3083 length:483 start_codon:yes stop_codon:yes gene_type:complete
MGKFIIGTFLLLGWGFYELSGGADFEPETRVSQQTALSTQTLTPVPFDAPLVTRATTIELPSIANPAQAQVIKASLATTPAVQVAPAVQEAAVSQSDVRQVSGNRVNMRKGPGTDYSVLDTLPRGTQAEVIEVTTDGWARIRVTTTDQMGWMAARLLSGS